MRILKRGPKAEMGSIDLLEEATHLLRRAPLQAWTVYYLCSVPFILGLLYFIADMSRGARAWDHLSAAALGMVLLFVLMKVGQAIFCDLLLHALHDDPFNAIWTRLHRIFCAQLALQPFGLFLLPVAALLTLPFGWCFALFQNFSVFGQGRNPLRREISTAWQQARTWPGQNHLTIGLLLLVWLVLLPVTAATLYLLPHLLQMLFGVESIFVQSNQHLLNTTFWSLVGGSVYLMIDPLVKATYVLRCFHGAALASGADLRVDLRRIQAGVSRLMLLAMVVGALFASVASGRAESTPVSATEVRQAVASEMNQPLYEWRMPRDQVPVDHDPGLLASLGEAIIDGLRWLGRQLKAFVELANSWLQKLLPDIEPDSPAAAPFFSETDPLFLALYLLCALGLGLAGVWLYRLWRRRQRREPPALAAAAMVPDLEADEVSAAELPADRWSALAEELLAKGEVRLALRALVLGALARLADEGYVKLARYKSNRDYLCELMTRGQPLVDLCSALAGNITTLEGVWYGDHSVDQQGLQLFLARHERIMRHGHRV